MGDPNLGSEWKIKLGDNNIFNSIGIHFVRNNFNQVRSTLSQCNDFEARYQSKIDICTQ